MLYVIYSTHGAEPIVFDNPSSAELHAQELRTFRAYRDVSLYVIEINVHQAYCNLDDPTTALVR